MSMEKTDKRLLTIYYVREKGKKLPLIRLRGKWLQNLGFEAGGLIEVEGGHGFLLLRLVSEAPCFDG